MKAYAKKDFDVSRIRRFLEPRPIVLVSSAWQTVMEFTPSRIGCIALKHM